MVIKYYWRKSVHLLENAKLWWRIACGEVVFFDNPDELLHKDNQALRMKLAALNPDKEEK